jgi:PilZ domain
MRGFSGRHGDLRMTMIRIAGRERKTMLTNAAERASHPTPRAERFPIHMMLRFRAPGEAEWLQGEIENISRSGILFRAPKVVDVNTPVELKFDLPVEVGGEPGAEVVSLGRIVRTILPPSSDAYPTAAVKFLNYRMARREK